MSTSFGSSTYRPMISSNMDSRGRISKRKAEDMSASELPAAKRRAPPSFANSRLMIKITTGPSPRNQFFVHKNFLCHYTSFFNDKFTPSMCTHMQNAEIDEVDAGVFGIFVSWLYSQGETICDREDDRADIDINKLLSLWQLAERLTIPTLQNQCMLQLLDNSFRGCMDGSVIAHIWRNTLANSPIRAIILEDWVAQWSHGTASSYQYGIPKEFYIEVFEAIRVRGSGTPQNMALSRLDEDHYYVSEMDDDEEATVPLVEPVSKKPLNEWPSVEDMFMSLPTECPSPREERELSSSPDSSSDSASDSAWDYSHSELNHLQSSVPDLVDSAPRDPRDRPSALSEDLSADRSTDCSSEASYFPQSVSDGYVAENDLTPKNMARLIKASSKSFSVSSSDRLTDSSCDLAFFGRESSLDSSTDGSTNSSQFGRESSLDASPEHPLAPWMVDRNSTPGPSDMISTSDWDSASMSSARQYRSLPGFATSSLQRSPSFAPASPTFQDRKPVQSGQRSPSFAPNSPGEYSASRSPSILLFRPKSPAHSDPSRASRINLESQSYASNSPQRSPSPAAPNTSANRSADEESVRSSDRDFSLPGFSAEVHWPAPPPRVTFGGYAPAPMNSCSMYSVPRPNWAGYSQEYESPMSHIQPYNSQIMNIDHILDSNSNSPYTHPRAPAPISFERCNNFPSAWNNDFFEAQERVGEQQIVYRSTFPAHRTRENTFQGMQAQGSERRRAGQSVATPRDGSRSSVVSCELEGVVRQSIEADDEREEGETVSPVVSEASSRTMRAECGW